MPRALLLFSLATPASIMADTRAFLDFIAAQADVKPGGIGTTGYWMGGLMSLTAAGTYPGIGSPLPRPTMVASWPATRLIARTFSRPR